MRNAQCVMRNVLVSVVIPMFNAEKFIGDCLESLLDQTLKDFEVVIVDDCSTDNSSVVVESFMEKFAAQGIRLHLIELQKNSGTPGHPRNIGIQIACGQYVCFLDSDDLLTETALEELTMLAENFQADVVHTDTFFMLKEDNELELCREQTLPPLSAPTFETQDLSKRIVNWINRGYNWESVTMFCKRIFLAANQINFPRLTTHEDMIFSFAVLCRAEKFLRVPNVTYIYRQRADSLSQKKFPTPAAAFHKWLRVLNDGLNEFANFMASEKFFAENPDHRYAVLNFFFHEVSKIFTPLYGGKEQFAFDDFIKKEFHAEDAELVAQLFNTVHVQRLALADMRQELAKFQKQ